MVCEWIVGRYFVCCIMRMLAARTEGSRFCRAVSIEKGFVPPQLQHTFYSRVTGKEAGRVDFIWHTEDGRIIVLEFDGMQKYIDPEMTSNRDVRQVVCDERQREQDLKEAGVSVVIRTNYIEVVQRAPFVMKLMQAGVPRAGRTRYSSMPIEPEAPLRS